MLYGCFVGDGAVALVDFLGEFEPGGCVLTCEGADEFSAVRGYGLGDPRQGVRFGLVPGCGPMRE
ncbi:hypothetical protein C6376_28285 [Streptomyces sp. P3]|nr:hypothetical protein C6376_28285 [Streptomyces sp. P3]